MGVGFTFPAALPWGDLRVGLDITGEEKNGVLRFSK
jgi:hypothetical protein